MDCTAEPLDVVSSPEGEIRLEILDFVFDIFQYELIMDGYLWLSPVVDEFHVTIDKQVRYAFKDYLRISKQKHRTAEIRELNLERVPGLMNEMYNGALRDSFQSGLSYCEKIMYIIRYTSHLACYFSYATKPDLKHVYSIGYRLARTLTLKEEELKSHGGWNSLGTRCRFNVCRQQFLHTDFKYYRSTYPS